MWPLVVSSDALFVVNEMIRVAMRQRQTRSLWLQKKNNNQGKTFNGIHQHMMEVHWKEGILKGRKAQLHSPVCF